MFTMFCATDKDGQTGIFYSMEEFVGYYLSGWQGTRDINAAARVYMMIQAERNGDQWWSNELRSHLDNGGMSDPINRKMLAFHCI